jgi:DNA-directed RNA polymerase specialized sigma24 family protein
MLTITRLPEDAAYGRTPRGEVGGAGRERAVSRVRGHKWGRLRDSWVETHRGQPVVRAIGPTEPQEWRIVQDEYASLHRFAAVIAPWDLEADDLLHDALVAVLRRRSLSDLDHPAAYLRKVMVNLAAGHSRRSVTRRRALRRLAAGTGESDVPFYPSEMADLEGLSPKERAVLYLSEIEGYHYREISRMLDCTEAAVRKRASRARTRLRAVMATEGPR